jgi:putative SOS response-associated peptidase YedK
LVIDVPKIGNFEPQTFVVPDYFAPIVRNFFHGRNFTKVRWGLPSSSVAQFEAAKRRAQKVQAKMGRDLTADEFKEMLAMEPDRGTTNVRNASSKHWQRWLAPEFRCVVPFNSFSEFNRDESGDVWYAFDNSRPLVLTTEMGR